MKPIASVVIPAHNEATVIGRTLKALVADDMADRLEIVVACNGCTDGTADIARRVAPSATVLEMDASSKVAALNAGDAAATVFPRIYLDADIDLEPQATEKLVDALTNGGALAAAPEPHLDTTKCTALVRSFYRTWNRSPFALSGHVGTGVYAVSEAGRARFVEFPELVADDLFVYSLFERSERSALTNCRFRIDPPRNVSSLFKVRTRVYYGNAEFAADRTWGDRSPSNSAASAKALIKSVRTPRQAVDTFVYLTVNSAAKAWALRQFRSKKRYVWARDESSRRVSFQDEVGR